MIGNEIKTRNRDRESRGESLRKENKTEVR